MFVGFMDQDEKPTETAKVIALMCTHVGIKLIYFRTCDVDMENGLVQGKIYKSSKWVSVQKRLPPIIDPSVECFTEETREIMSYLRKNAILTFDNQNMVNANTQTIQNRLLNDDAFSYFIIPTENMSSFETLINFLNKHSFIVLNPVHRNNRGESKILYKRGNLYVLSDREEQKELTYAEFMEYYKNSLANEKYILQKFIESRNKNDDLFYCRVHVQKNKHGKWEIAKALAKISLGNKDTFDAQYEGISNINPFFKANFGSNWRELYKDLKKLSLELSYKIEELKNIPMMSLDLDIGIDNNDKFWLFKANDETNVKPFIAEPAMLRLEYYQHIQNHYPELKKRNKLKLKENKLHEKIEKLQKKNESLAQEKNSYRNETEQMKSSVSWRLTRPLRKISSYLKRS